MKTGVSRRGLKCPLLDRSERIKSGVKKKKAKSAEGNAKAVRRDHPGDVLDDAHSLAANGEFVAALKKHVWFHENALRIRQSYYGVSLSFALAAWVKLGEKYPPALAEFRSIRNENTGRIISGTDDRNLFHDVVSINEYLGDADASVKLFKQLDSTRSEFASDVFSLADLALVGAGEYLLAKKYLRNGVEGFEQAERNFREGMDYAVTSKNPKISKEAEEGIFTKDVLRIITVLRESGEAEQAMEIKKRAQIVFDHRKIRGARTKK